MKLPLSLAIFVAIGCTCASFSQAPSDAIKYEILEQQKKIVGQLTGYLPIKGKKKLKARGTTNERKLTSEFLYDKLRELGIRVYQQDYHVADEKGREYAGINIYGNIPATGRGNEYVILCANYDTAKESPGAIHNATGISLIYSVAKKLLSLKKRSKNVLIVFFDQQHKKMIGCRMFVDLLKKRKYNVHSMHRIDYVGWDKDKDKAIEILSSNISLETKYRIFSKTPVFKRYISTPEAALFSKLGYETITITSELKNGDSSPFINLASDTYDTVDFEHLYSTVNVVYNVFAGILE